MQFMIYKLALMSLVMASALLSKTADAQAKVIVPFAFNMGGVTYPAGTYFIERVPLSRFVSLQNKDGRQIKSWSLGSGDPAPTDTRVGLVFDEVGSKYLLRAVRYGSLITPRLDGYTRSNQQGESQHHESD